MNYLSADQVIEKLKEGNQKYINQMCTIGDTSIQKRVQTYIKGQHPYCLLYTSPSPRDFVLSRMPSSA